MRLPPLLLVSTAAAITLVVSQAVLPTAHAQDTMLVPSAKIVPQACRAAVRSLHLTRTSYGTEVTGELLNTGPQPLVYTSVALMLHAAEQPAYLVNGPVRPGQSAEFRAVLPPAPTNITSAEITVCLREAGQAVTVEQMLQTGG